MIELLQKLRGRSGEELRVRAVQALNAYGERRGWAEQARVPGDAAFFKLLDPAPFGGAPASAERLLAHFRGRESPHFFAAFDKPASSAAELRRRFGGAAEERTVARARRVVEGHFDLLGLHDLSFGDPIDWQFEPVARKRAPSVHWSRVDFLNAAVAGDKKITWELNRHQYFMTLGRAYWYTRDELYARTFASHLDSWMNANPPKVGINWASSLEVSFRAMSWLWALHFFRESEALPPALFLRALKFLYVHARHLETYLSTYFSPNTHLTGEALGLFYLGTLLPEFKLARRWRETGLRVLLAQLDRHVRPDGVYFEQSSYYHRYTADFYTHLYILGRANGESFAGGKLEAKLRQLLDHLMYITRPDGTTPFVGDDDGGRLVMLDERPANDFRAALATGAALFDRGDYKYVAGGAAEETLWLLGTRGLAAFDQLTPQPPACASRAFPAGGYYVMRDGWTREANYLLLDCGPHGALNYGHAHADALAFDLAARGRTLLVDPGTYTYTGSAELRSHFRSAAAHNTLTVGGESSSVPAGPFTWRHVARAKTHDWLSHPRFDFFAGSHDGYERLTPPATHTRRVLFIKGDYWIVADGVATAGAHPCRLHFQFAPGTAPVIDARAGCVREATGDAPGLDLFVFAPGGAWGCEQGWVSECYGARVAAPACVFAAASQDPQEFATFLLPRAQGAAAAIVRELEAVGGRAFEVHIEGVRDVVLKRVAQVVETLRLVSDFEWTWARFAGDAEVPEELVLIGGHRLSLDGTEVIRSEARIGYLVLRWMGGALSVDTDARPLPAVQSPGSGRASPHDAEPSAWSTSGHAKRGL
jgi:hypothetical protein